MTRHPTYQSKFNKALCRVVMLTGCLLTMVGLAAEPGSDDEAKRAADPHDFIYMADEAPIFVRLRLQIDGKNLSTVWDEYVSDYFKELDTDNDQVLSPTEAKPAFSRPAKKATSALGALRQGFSGLFSKSSKSKKATGNTNLTRSEFKKQLLQSAQGPFSLRHMRQSSSIGGMQTNANSVDLFDMVDTDDNDRLDSKEIDVGFAMLSARDLDVDELVSTEELQSSNPYAAFVPMQNTQLQKPRSRFVHLGPDLDKPVDDGRTDGWSRLARRLRDKYGQPTKAARQARRELTGKSLRLPSVSFRRFDTDADGVLSDEELISLLKRPAPTMELKVRLGDRDESQSVFEVTQAATDAGQSRLPLRLSQNGAPMIDLDGTQIEFAVDDVPVNAEFVRTIAQAQVQVADRDKNGYLEPKEFDSRLERIAERVDRNGDGKIFPEELLTFLDQELQSTANRIELRIHGPDRNLFEILDTNGDNRLAESEFRAAGANLTHWDRDKDSQIARAEVPRKYRLVIGRRTSEFGDLAALAAQNLYYGVDAAKALTGGPRWFRNMDRNNDGRVSHREFLYDGALFQRMDRNRDGMIDSAEAADRLR